MFRQAWEQPGQSSQDSGQPGLCSATASCGERELVVPRTPIQAAGITVDTSTPRPSPQHPWGTETERVLASPLRIDSTSGQRTMGGFRVSAGMFFLITGAVRWNTERSADLRRFDVWVNMQ